MTLLRYLVFENPMTLWAVLGMAAVVAGLVWSRTGSARARAAAVGCVAAAAVLGLVAWLVETDRERLLRTLETMNRAAENGHAEVFVECVSPAYGGPGGKEALAEVVRQGLRYVRATAETPRIDERPGEAAVTQVYRFSPAPGKDLLLPPEMRRVTWEGVFAPDADGQWRLRSAVATHPKRLTPEEAARYLPRAK